MARTVTVILWAALLGGCGTSEPSAPALDAGAGAEAATDGGATQDGAAPDTAPPDPTVWGCAGLGVWAQEAKLLPSDGRAGEGFGYRVAASGDTIVVGQPRAGGGGVYVFERVADTWAEQARLTDAAGSDCFGSAVALDGDTLVVATPCAAATGAAAVLQRAGGVWSEVAHLAADIPQAELAWVDVALDGDTALVCAVRLGATLTDSELEAFVAVDGAAGWARQATLGAPAPDPQYGVAECRVALSGDTAAVRMVPAAGQANRIAIQVGSGASWTQEQELQVGARGGMSLAGDTLAAGDETWAAAVFERRPAGWWGPLFLQNAFLPTTRLGASVLTTGAMLVAGTGAPRDWAQPADGYAFVYAPCDGQWRLVQAVLPADTRAGLGVGLALANGSLVVGAPLDGERGDLAGAAYVFRWAAVAGVGCTSDADCAPGTCVAGSCCDAPCTADCWACTAAGKGYNADGECGRVIEGGDCANGGYCQQHMCLSKRERGDNCGYDGMCHSGYCVDYVCCDRRCDQVCENCTRLAGTCTLSQAGARARGVCVAGAPEPLPGQDPMATGCAGGTCDGVQRDTCTPMAAGTQCDQMPAPDAYTCAGETLHGPFCDGAGHCVTGDRTCAPFACFGPTCGWFCDSDAQCAAGHHCDSAQRVCD